MAHEGFRNGTRVISGLLPVNEIAFGSVGETG